MRASRTVLIGLAMIALVAAPSVATAATAGFTLGPPSPPAAPAHSAPARSGAVEGADPPSVNYPNTELEPFMAVNPVNEHIIGVYQQDRWSDGGAHGLVASRSDTRSGLGSELRRSSASARTTRRRPTCRPSTAPRIRGSASTRPGRHTRSPSGSSRPTSTSAASKSRRRSTKGRTWSLPVRLITSTDPITFNDKQSITGDWRPVDGAGKAYATWIVGDLPGGDHIGPNGAAHSFAYGAQPVSPRRPTAEPPGRPPSR